MSRIRVVIDTETSGTPAETFEAIQTAIERAPNCQAIEIDNGAAYELGVDITACPKCAGPVDSNGKYCGCAEE